MDRPATAWVVAGAPGAGKTTVAGLLCTALDPHPAVLDKDTMYGSFVAATLAAAGRDPGEREGAWYDEHVKVHEYGGMTATARQIRAFGCPVLLVGPFTRQIHDAGSWRQWAGMLGGGDVRLVWVRADERTVRQRLAERGSGRDAGKLADFAAFAARMRLDAAPAAPHHAVDNRLDAQVSLHAQIEELVRWGVQHHRRDGVLSICRQIWASETCSAPATTSSSAACSWRIARLSCGWRSCS
jgi:predicted kinase